MQGLFVHVTDGAFPVTGTLGVNNDVRITDLTHTFLKSNHLSPYFLLRLVASFTDDTLSSDPMVIYFNNDANTGFDSKFDALKLLNTDLKVTNLYALLPDGTKLSIDALPEMTDTIKTIPLGLMTYKSGEISFRIRDIENLPPGMKIYLHDAVTGINRDLLPDQEYIIDLTAGEYSNRFSLKLLNSTSNLPDVDLSSDFFNVYSSNGIVKANVGSLDGREGVIYIFDLVGHQVFSQKVFEEGYYEFNPLVKPGIYFVTLLSGNYKNTKKIFILNK